MIPRKGAEVAKISEKSLRDVLEVRRSLEELAIELACQRMSEEEIDNLQKAQDDFKNAIAEGDAMKIAETDEHYHDVIYEGTQNAKLIQMLNNLREQMYRYRFEYIKDSSQHERLVEEHKVIYESIVKKDKETASHMAKVHIDNQKKAIIRQIRTGAGEK